MNDAADYWNQLAPSADQVTDQQRAEALDPGSTAYEGRHRGADLLDEVEDRAAAWLHLIDHVDELRQLCLDRGLGEALSQRLVEAFARSFTEETEPLR